MVAAMREAHRSFKLWGWVIPKFRILLWTPITVNLKVSRNRMQGLGPSKWMMVAAAAPLPAISVDVLTVMLAVWPIIRTYIRLVNTTATCATPLIQIDWQWRTTSECISLWKNIPALTVVGASGIRGSLKHTPATNSVKIFPVPFLVPACRLLLLQLNMNAMGALKSLIQPQIWPHITAVPSFLLPLPPSTALIWAWRRVIWGPQSVKNALLPVTFVAALTSMLAVCSTTKTHTKLATSAAHIVTSRTPTIWPCATTCESTRRRSGISAPPVARLSGWPASFGTTRESTRKATPVLAAPPAGRASRVVLGWPGTAAGTTR